MLINIRLEVGPLLPFNVAIYITYSDRKPLFPLLDIPIPSTLYKILVKKIDGGR